jgi:hypothetical protein
MAIRSVQRVYTVALRLFRVRILPRLSTGCVTSQHI